MAELKKVFKSVKQLSWQEATVSFYIVKRRLIHREARYELLTVNIDNELAKKIRGIVNSKVEHSNAVREYDFVTSDLNSDVLGIETSDTDFSSIIEFIESGEDIPSAAAYSDLLGSWIYIARLDLADKPPLYAARQVSGGWTAKKVMQLVNAIFENNMLIDLEHKEVFRIDSRIDFFSFGGVLFIADKKNFEAALNFREGMERNRDSIVAEFEKLEIFANAQDIKGFVGNNINRLRKLSQVKNSGYYKDSRYLDALRIVNEQENWGLEYDHNGHIIASEDTIENVLKYLNNDRLSSKINNEEFDVDVKHKLS